MREKLVPYFILASFGVVLYLMALDAQAGATEGYSKDCWYRMSTGELLFCEKPVDTGPYKDSEVAPPAVAPDTRFPVAV